MLAAPHVFDSLCTEGPHLSDVKRVITRSQDNENTSTSMPSRGKRLILSPKIERTPPSTCPSHQRTRSSTLGTRSIPYRATSNDHFPEDLFTANETVTHNKPDRIFTDQNMSLDDGSFHQAKSYTKWRERHPKLQHFN